MSRRSQKYLLPGGLWLCIVVLSFGFSKKDEEVRFVQPKGWPKPFYDVSRNKVTDAGFALGRKLFFDPVLSGDGSIACSGCHMQAGGFAHAGSSFSHGIGGAKGKRNSLPMFNLAWNTSFMWDGGVNNLEVQPLAPMSSTSEMATTLEAIVRKLDKAKEYKLRFFLAFGDSAVTGQRVLKALAQYMVLLESYNSRYDKYVRGEAGGVMTKQELSGLKLFRSQCASCHVEPLFSNYSFQNIGLPVDTALNDYGRMGITNDAKDSLKFKVPSLRNVVVTAPYMHDGRFSTLKQVLDHYIHGVVQGPTLADKLSKPMRLTEQDKEALIAFMHTLTDTAFLANARYWAQ